MEAKFTKGEWRIIRTKHGLYDMVVSENGTCIAEVVSNRREFDHPSQKEGAANSDLIAAAPEMYEALKQILDGCPPATEREAFMFVDIAKSIAKEALKKAARQ